MIQTNIGKIELFMNRNAIRFNWFDNEKLQPLLQRFYNNKKKKQQQQTHYSRFQQTYLLDDIAVRNAFLFLVTQLWI